MGALQATYQATTTLQGSGLGPGNGPALQDTQSTTPSNTNAPPPQQFVTSIGSTQWVWPTSAQGYTFTRVQLMSVASSPASKTIKGVSGDTGISGWQTGSITIPAAPGGSIYVVNTQVETVIAYFS
jgi:hypothetical protein